MHTIGLYYIHKVHGLQITTAKSTDETTAMKDFAKSHKKTCVKVTCAWISEPGNYGKPVYNRA